MSNGGREGRTNEEEGEDFDGGERGEVWEGGDVGGDVGGEETMGVPCKFDDAECGTCSGLVSNAADNEAGEAEEAEEAEDARPLRR